MKTNKLAIFAILALVTALTSFNAHNAFAQTSNDTELYPVRVNGKEGYIDATGRIVIKPQFQSVEYFSEGLAHVCIGNKSGFIDKTGRFVINPQFDNARGFSEGLAQGLGRTSLDGSGKDIADGVEDDVGLFLVVVLHELALVLRADDNGHFILTRGIDKVI